MDNETQKELDDIRGHIAAAHKRLSALIPQVEPAVTSRLNSAVLGLQWALNDIDHTRE